MEYRYLGRTGLKVSTICLGTMQFGWSSDEATAHEVMSEAVELGCNFIDTADVYSRWVEGNEGGVAEEIIGNWLQRSGVRRQDVIIATKVRGAMSDDPNDRGLSRHHIMNAVDESLRRLQTDYIDLYQTHAYEEHTPLEETLRAMDDLVRMGKVRYVGCSNYPAWRLMKALWVSDANGYVRYDSLQPHYNMVHRREFEEELQPLCQDQGLGVIPYSPLAAGFLTGKYRRDEPLPESDRAEGVQKRYMNERGFQALDKLEAVAQEHNATMAQTAIAWILANPTVSSAIIGANSVEQLRDTMKGAEIKMSEEQKQMLDEATAWKED
jgi:aryl-alcohol dehydrogenase-like predicted oxidoreductase